MTFQKLDLRSIAWIALVYLVNVLLTPSTAAPYWYSTAGSCGAYLGKASRKLPTASKGGFCGASLANCRPDECCDQFGRCGKSREACGIMCQCTVSGRRSKCRGALRAEDHTAAVIQYQLLLSRWCIPFAAGGDSIWESRNGKGRTFHEKTLLNTPECQCWPLIINPQAPQHYCGTGLSLSLPRPPSAAAPSRAAPVASAACLIISAPLTQRSATWGCATEGPPMTSSPATRLCPMLLYGTTHLM